MSPRVMAQFNFIEIYRQWNTTWTNNPYKAHSDSFTINATGISLYHYDEGMMKMSIQMIAHLGYKHNGRHF